MVKLHSILGGILVLYKGIYGQYWAELPGLSAQQSPNGTKLLKDFLLSYCIHPPNGTNGVSVMFRPGFFAASGSGEVTSFPVLV
jgi:hypothetical protein